MRTQTTPNQAHPTRDTVADEPAPAIAAAVAERPSRLMEATDVARVLGVRETFVYALARRGDLPAVRLGERYVRFRPEALSAWIAQRESTRPRGTR